VINSNNSFIKDKSGIILNMSILAKIFSIIALPFILLYSALSSVIVGQMDTSSGYIVVHDEAEAKKEINRLIGENKDVPSCNTLRGVSTYNFSTGNVYYICINSFAKAKKDISICSFHTYPDPKDLCIFDIAVENDNKEWCSQILSENYRNGCQQQIQMNRDGF